MQCQRCGGEFESVGRHWGYNPEHRPSFTDRQKEIITGVLMGDGSVLRDGNNPYLRVEMVSENYLQYLDGEFGVLGTGVSPARTAEESAKHCRSTGFNDNADGDNYSDLYRWQSRRHPELGQYSDWYSSGEKVWPEDIEITPTVLKHFYCGDGTWRNTSGKNHIQFEILNESNNIGKVDSLFENAGLPSPNNYNINPTNCKASFTVEQSYELWEYMGEPLPDFGYKWPEEFRKT